MVSKDLIQHIRQLIAKDDLPKAIKLLQTILDNSPYLNEVLFQSGRFSNITKQIRKGIIGRTLNFT